MALSTLTKVYSKGADYIAQDEFLNAANTICQDQGLATFVVDNMMNFREVSYRPDYGLDTSNMQKNIQQLGGNQKIKTELEGLVRICQYQRDSKYCFAEGPIHSSGYLFKNEYGSNYDDNS